MKSGAVAVENSVDALKSGKLKNRTAMVHASPHSPHMQHLRPYEPQLARYQPHLYARAPMPYQHQPYAVLQSYPAVPRTSTHQRYGVNAAPMKPYGIGHSGVTGQVQLVHQHPPPPPLPQESDLKQSQALHPSPPVSLPVQLQASAGDTARGRAKRGVCVRYKRGCCYYGSHCKFLHDGETISPAPQSAPPATAERTQPQIPPTPPDDNQCDTPSSLRDANFPSLWTKTSENDAIAESRGSQVIREQPANKLVFLDAVLQQKCKPMKARMKTSKGPTDSDDDKAYSSNQSVDGSDEESRSSQRDSASIEDTQHFQPPQPVQELGHSPNTRTGRRDRPSFQSPLQSEHFTHKSPLQVLFPEPGRPGYAVQSVYLNPQDEGADDSTAFSALSRDANGFVRRLDSRLRELLPFQERAINKLQELVTSIWSDATISVYGSSFTRLALPQSDVDCVLSTPSSASEQPSELLRKLAFELRRHPWARRVDLVDSAKIPVLKVVFCHALKSRTEVMLDLTCANSPGHSGLSARNLIYSYQVEMPALRPLVLILKSHIQRRGLNSAFTGGLSSYGLVILAIRFLQACGDEHHVRETSKYGRFDGGHQMPEICGQPIGYTQYRSNAHSSSPPIYEFTRDGKLTWRTGLGNLLLLFLETYVTFDYRRFGVTVEGNGQYFPLPSEMVPLEPGAVVSPYIVDPISVTRSIGNSFRMHEIIQAWYELYQQLANGISVEDATLSPAPVNRPA